MFPTQLSGGRRHRAGRHKLASNEIDAQIHSLQSVSSEEDHVTGLGKYCNGG